jgi:hypothetical protein
MALGHAPSIPFDRVWGFIDPFNPRCFDGTSTTMVDLFNQTSATGDSLSSISSSQGIIFGTNKNSRVSFGSTFPSLATSDYTKICWFNLDDVSTKQPLLCGENGRHWMWMNSTANLTLSHTGTRTALAPNLANVVGTTSLSTGVWYFGAVSWGSPASANASIGFTGGKVYLNGLLETYNPAFNVSVSSAGGTVHIGRTLDATISAPILNGKISYALVYNRVLSDQEILQIYNATKKRYGL